MKKKLVHIKGEITDHIGSEGYYPCLGIKKEKHPFEDKIVTIIETYDGDVDRDKEGNYILNDFGDKFGFSVEYEKEMGNGDNFEIVTVDMEELKQKIKDFIDDEGFTWALDYMRMYRAAQLSIE